MRQILTVHTDLIKAVVSGEFSLEEAKRIFLDLLVFVERHNGRKVLLDGRRIVGNPATIERFYYGSFAAEEVQRLSQSAVFAYVLIPPVLDSRRFGETVAVNRGMAVKAFMNVSQALQWLGCRHSDG